MQVGRGHSDMLGRGLSTDIKKGAPFLEQPEIKRFCAKKKGVTDEGGPPDNRIGPTKG